MSGPDIDTNEKNAIGGIDRFVLNIALTALSVFPTLYSLVVTPWRLAPLLLGNYIVHSLASFLHRRFRLFRFPLPLFRRLRFRLGPVGQHQIRNRVERFHNRFRHRISPS